MYIPSRNPKYFNRTKEEIISRNGACFGISCGDCPLSGEYIKNYGFTCKGGGQGNYSEIVEELNKIK